jgi:hypothetical protein
MFKDLGPDIKITYVRTDRQAWPHNTIFCISRRRPNTQYTINMSICLQRRKPAGTSNKWKYSRTVFNRFKLVLKAKVTPGSHQPILVLSTVLGDFQLLRVVPRTSSTRFRIFTLIDKLTYLVTEMSPS